MKSPPGVRFVGNDEAEITLWAPEATHAVVIVSDHKTNILLEKNQYGYWAAKTNKLKPDDRYWFQLDNKKPLPDPASLSQPDGVHEASCAVDLQAAAWTDNDWKNIPLEDYILYELHTGTFTPEGTFAGIEAKLDYLRDLGVTAIEIMPVAQFPGTRNWGYDGVYPYAVQASYGGAEGLQKLVNAAHEKGLAVILDAVYNHMGPEGNYFNEYAPYFVDKYTTCWGQALNFDDAWCDGVRHFFVENALMWFRDFHIDALRLDAVHAIKDFSARHILREIKERTDELMKETGRTYYLIAECDLNDRRFVTPLEHEGYGMDAQWMDEFHHALRVTAGEERIGYYSDFNGIGHLAKSFLDAYVYDGQYSAHRRRHFGNSAKGLPGSKFIVFSQNHDQVGNRMLGERTNALISFGMQKVMAAAVIVSPYLPMLFMGEEWSEPAPFLYFVSHSDPELAEAVRKGRAAEFASFHREGEAPDPVAEETFQRSKLQWHLTANGHHNTMLRYYKKLLSLRKSEPALRNLNREQMTVVLHESQEAMMMHRWHDDQHLLCLLNFSESRQPAVLPGPAESWQLLLSSADPEWGGDAEKSLTAKNGESIFMAPESVLLYSAIHA